MILHIIMVYKRQYYFIHYLYHHQGYHFLDHCYSILYRGLLPQRKFLKKNEIVNRIKCIRKNV